jgi:hypothetical protein
MTEYIYKVHGAVLTGREHVVPLDHARPDGPKITHLLTRARPSHPAARALSILVSLEPAAAALVAAVLLSEWLTPLQLLAMPSVTAASVGADRTASAPAALPEAR